MNVIELPDEIKDRIITATDVAMGNAERQHDPQDVPPEVLAGVVHPTGLEEDKIFIPNSKRCKRQWIGYWKDTYFFDARVFLLRKCGMMGRDYYTNGELLENTVMDHLGDNSNESNHDDVRVLVLAPDEQVEAGQDEEELADDTDVLRETNQALVFENVRSVPYLLELDFSQRYRIQFWQYINQQRGWSKFNEKMIIRRFLCQYYYIDRWYDDAVAAARHDQLLTEADKAEVERCLTFLRSLLLDWMTRIHRLFELEMFLVGDEHIKPQVTSVKVHIRIAAAREEFNRLSALARAQLEDGMDA